MDLSHAHKVPFKGFSECYRRAPPRSYFSTRLLPSSIRNIVPSWDYKFVEQIREHFFREIIFILKANLFIVYTVAKLTNLNLFITITSALKQFLHI